MRHDFGVLDLVPMRRAETEEETSE